MGQRVQIYIRETVNGVVTNFVARYNGWNYGSRMVSRCRYALEWLKKESKPVVIREESKRYPLSPDQIERLNRILDTNFDMIDVILGQDIVDEYYELFSDEPFNDVIFFEQDNNNGKLLIDINDGILKYAFLDGNADSNNIMTAEQYMEWDSGEQWRENHHLQENGEIKACDANFPVIKELASLMSKEEVDEFLSFDYVNHISKPKKTLEREAIHHAYRELILEINNHCDCMDIDNPTFIEDICKKMNIKEWKYNDIMGNLLKEQKDTE